MFHVAFNLPFRFTNEVKLNNDNRKPNSSFLHYNVFTKHSHTTRQRVCVCVSCIKQQRLCLCVALLRCVRSCCISKFFFFSLSFPFPLEPYSCLFHRSYLSLFPFSFLSLSLILFRPGHLRPKMKIFRETGRERNEYEIRL